MLAQAPAPERGRIRIGDFEEVQGAAMRQVHARAAMILAVTLAATLATASASLPAAAQNGPQAATTAKPDPLCASYGAGFTRLAGTQTCVKISSSVQTDAYGSDVSGSVRVDPLAPALKSK